MKARRDEGSDWWHRTGMPFIPYLSVLTLTAIFWDVNWAAGKTQAKIADLACADDTLLASEKPAKLQQYLSAPVEAAAKYGSTLNLGKTTHLHINHEVNVSDECGRPIKVCEQAQDLGYILCAYHTLLVQRYFRPPGARI